MVIRDFRFDDSDYQAHLKLVERANPHEPTSVAALRWSDQARPDNVWWRKRVAEVDGRFAALGEVGEPHWSRQAGKVHLSVEVDPACLNRGIGTRLYADLEALARARGPVHRLVTGTQEDQSEARRFLLDRGFAVNIRVPVSALDLAAFDATPFVHRIEQVQSLGLRLASLANLARAQSDWQERYWRFETAIGLEVANPGPFTPRPLETFIRQKMEHPGFAPDATHVAVHGNEWVGLSELKIDPGRTRIGSTGLTAVARPWRRKGLATALKLKVLGQARAKGVRRVITDNEEHNSMFQLNLRLGFKARPAWLGWQLNLTDHE